MIMQIAVTDSFSKVIAALRNDDEAAVRELVTGEGDIDRQCQLFWNELTDLIRHQPDTTDPTGQVSFPDSFLRLRLCYER